MMGGADELFGSEQVPSVSGADQLFSGEEEQSERQLKFVMDSSIDETPERAARAFEIQKKTGIPKKFIDENFDELDRTARQSDFDPKHFTKSNPKISEWLSRNPDYAPLIREDESIGALESAISNTSKFFSSGEPWSDVLQKRTESAGHALNLQLAGAEQTVAMARQAPSEFAGHFGAQINRAAAKGMAYLVAPDWALTPEQIKTKETFINRIAPEPGYSQTAIDAVSKDPLFVEGMDRASYHTGRIQELQPKVPEWSGKDLIGSAYESFLTSVLPMMATAYAGGGVFGGTALFSGQVYTQNLAEDLNEGMPLSLAQEHASWKILSEGIPESIPLSVAMKAGKGFWSKTLTVALVEGVEEGLTEMADVAYETLKLDKDISFKEAVNRTFKAMAIGSITGGGMGAVSSIPAAIENRKHEKTAKVQEDFFRALGENATNSKLRERLPDSYQEIIGELTKDGPVENVYTPVEFFQSHFQEQGIDPRQLATELGIERQYDEAVNTGGKIAIPTAVYAKDIAATEHNAMFAKELSFAPDQMSSRETGEFLKEAEKDKEPETDEFGTSLEAAMSPIREQIRAIYPRDIADLMSAAEESRLKARSTRIGIDPQELMKRRPLSIMEGGEETGNILNQIAFHGSPYKFQRFDLSKIGTGEGAQAFGHGLYFAGNSVTADFYGEKGAAGGSVPMPQNTGDFITGNTRYVRGKGNIQKQVGNVWSDISKDEYGAALRKAQEEYENRPKGNLYKVDISEDAIKNFLDWDKPLSEQPEVVRKALIEAAKKKNPRLSEYWKKTAGMSPEESAKAAKSMGLNVFDIIDAGGAALEAILGRGPEASQYLKSKGVPGIRYLDQGSRESGKGTSNYVVFDESIIKILDVNGEPVPASEQKKIVDAMNKEGELFQSDVKKQTETPEFQAWFGDSKVVDEKGDPLVVYHGTSKDITEFNTKGGPGKSFDTGAFFSASHKIADTYTGGIGGSVVPVYLSLKNPVVIDAQGKNWNAITQSAPVGLPAVEVSDQADEDLMAALEDRPPQQGVTKKTKAKKTKVRELFSGEWDYPDDTTSTDDLARWARRNGYDGLVVKNVVDQGPTGTFASDKSKTPDTMYVVFSPEQIKSSISNRGSFDPNDPNILAQEGKDTKRGSISVSPTGDIIRLFKAKNLSTLLHELSHRWLFEMQDDASMPEAPQQIKDDLAETLKYLGLENVEQADITRFKKGTKEHARAVAANEKFAQTGEAYFMEGKAPSTALRRVFATLKAWMVAIYKALKQGRLDAELTPAMRGVFDRLLATDEEIEAATAQANAIPAFTTAEDAGYTEAEFSAYRKTVEDANREAREELDVKVMKQYKKTLTDIWKEEKAKVQVEVEAELDKDPIYSAMAKMKENGIRIDRSEAGSLPKSFTDKNGIPADMAAEMLGFTSGEAMVKALASVEARGSRVSRETSIRMDQQFGNMLTDGTIMEDAKKAVMSDSRAKIIEAEIKALNKKAREVKPFLKGKDKAEAEASRAGRDIYRGLVPKLADVREHAKSVIAGKLVREIKPHQYFSAARQASRSAIDAMRKADYLLAAYHKGRELLNLELYRSANSAKEAIEDGNEKLQKAFVADIKQSKTRNMDMVNAARAILASHGLGRSDDSPTVYLDKMREYDPDTYNNLRPLFEPALANMKNYKEMTFEEYIGMRDAVLALMKTSRRSKQMEVDGKLIERDEVVANLVNRIGELSEIRGKDKQKLRSTMTDLQETKVGLTSAKAMLRRVEHWVDAMDGGNPNGAFRTYLWNPVIDQINKYRDEKRKVISKYLEAIQEVAKTIEKGAIEAPEIGFKFKGKNELLHAILHTGNESNKAKLLIGYGWGERLEDGTLVTYKWDSFEKRMQDEGVLTKVDYDFAQKVWDIMEEMKPTLQEAHHKMYGFYFSEVTANEFSNRFGTYRGGYLPAKVDQREVPEAEQRKDAEEIIQGQNSFAFPTTGKGSTMKRLDSYARPLQLDMRSIPVHIDWAMRFAYIEPSAKDAARVLLNRDFAKAMNDLDSTAINHMLVPWLQRSAQQITSTRGMNKYVDKFWTGFRGRAGLQVMALNVINTLQQFTGLTIAFTKVKPSSMRTSFWTYLTNHKAMSEEINEKSLFMRNRVFTSHNEVMQTIDDLLLNPSKYENAKDFATRHGYFMQQATQGFVDQVVWKAAYNEALSRGDTDGDAVRHADSTVRETQGSFAPEDISRFEAGSPFVRAFSMFYNYFNMQANLLGTEFSNIMTNELGLRKGAGRALYIYTFAFLIPAFIGDAVLRALIAGEPDEDDDGYMDDLIGMFFSSQYKALFATVPIVGPAANYAVNVWNEKWYDDKITTSPGISMIESAGRAPLSVYKAIVDDGNEKKAVKDTLSLIGMATGLPAGALGRPLGYLADVHQGKARPESTMDVMRGLVSGQDVNRAQ